MRTRVEFSWVELTWLQAGWLEWSYVELLHCIALQCISWHVMAWLDDCCIFIPHDVCVVAVVFFIANISLCLPYSYLIAILMLNIKLYVQCPNYISTHKQQQKHTYIHSYIVSHLLWRSYSGGTNYYLLPIRCCVHICLNSTCLCDFSKNLYTFFSTFFFLFISFLLFSRPALAWWSVGRANVKLSVHSIQNINFFGM